MKTVLIFLFLLIFTSCRKEIEPIQLDSTPIKQGDGVFICNEGNFQFGNSKVGHYNYSTGVYQQDLYRVVNGVPLGDVCQSMVQHNDRIYVVVNNSGKIEVVNASDFKSLATISGFVSPRYMCVVSSSKAYVTDLYSNKIAIVNLLSNTITGYISCPGWTEELLFFNNEVYVTNYTRGKVYVVNPTTDALQDSIVVAKGANSLVLDKNSNLWVMCSGEATTSTVSALYKINSANHQTVTTLVFPSQVDSPFRLSINASKDTLFYLNTHVFKLDINSTSVSSTPFINSIGSFYGLKINPYDNTIWVADAIDYIQNGKVYTYNTSGILQHTISVGIIPSDFLFY
ncbi:MAG: YncE family protein [Bacteroidetes bacterium]|nr:YncE family protein [Bacteroidota bacterium]